MSKKERHEHGGHSSAAGLDLSMVLSESGIVEGSTVLDLGCGIGDYSVAASTAVGSAGQVYALDSDGDSLRGLAGRINDLKITNILIIRSDMTNGIQISDSKADVVLFFNVLHGLVWNGEEEKPLREIHRVLKEGGILSVMEPIPGMDGHGPPEEVRLSQDRIEDILAPYGFRTARSKVVHPGRGLVIMKAS